MSPGLAWQICLLFGSASLLSIGGGNSVVPEIELRAVSTYHWVTGTQFADLFAIAQTAPGPSILLVTLVGYAAVGTGVIFFAMGAVAQTIKRDLSFMGKFLFVGMIALLIAMLANMFLQIPALALTISTLVIVVFSMFLVYDLQRIMRGGETNYVMATTGVYMSLFNIFANLLHLLLALAGDRD